MTNGGVGGGTFGFGAPWQCDIEKYYNGEYWSNRYHLNAADASSALTIGRQIMELERKVTHSAVLFSKVSVRTTIEGDEDYKTFLPNLNGLMTTSGELLPLFCVVRVDFSVDVGRPSRKYLRAAAAETGIVGANLVANHRTHIQDNYAAPLAALDAYVDIDGQPIVAGAVHPQISMRQTRRGSKKKKDPSLVGD